MYYLTIGSYDGVHRGHLKIIEKLVNNRLKLKSAVLYFPVPPKFFFSGNVEGNLLTTAWERENLLKEKGVDRIERINFDEEFYRMRAEEFFEKIIVGKYRAKGLVVGRDFAIGYMREGNKSFLEKKCKQHNIDFEVIDFVKFEAHKISSTLIRNFLHRGEIEKANYCLSREYFVSGKVIKGAGIGKKIGFPTANLEVSPLKLLPHGVFAVRVLYNGKYYQGVANIGFRPTFKTFENKLTVEVHILDFNRDIYGQKLTILFYKKIRNETKFRNIEELVSNIKNDIFQAKIILSSITKNYTGCR